jgi:hypothetical protein
MNKKSVNIKEQVRPIKFERIYEDEETISIWKYDYNKTRNGPVEVEIKYKRGYVPPKPEKKKTLGDLANDAKKVTKSQRPKS